jgi:uncharacterized protein YqjF (DUF2071 family)
MTWLYSWRADVKPVEGGMPGIYFFTLDCSGALPALGASMLFHLPYRLASIQTLRDAHGTSTFVSARRFSSAALEVAWRTSGEPETAGPVAREAAFFVERYCLYNEAGPLLRAAAMPRAARLWRGSITHAPWPVQRARICSLEHSLLDWLGLEPSGPCRAYFSPGVSAIDFFWEPVEPQ